MTVGFIPLVTHHPWLCLATGKGPWTCGGALPSATQLGRSIATCTCPPSSLRSTCLTFTLLVLTPYSVGTYSTSTYAVQSTEYGVHSNHHISLWVGPIRRPRLEYFQLGRGVITPDGTGDMEQLDARYGVHTQSDITNRTHRLRSNAFDFLAYS